MFKEISIPIQYNRKQKMGKRKSYFHKKSESQAEKKLKLKFGESYNKIDTNMKGFLVTYNCKFTFCLNESKKLLQQFSLPEKELDESAEKGSDLDKELQQELDRYLKHASVNEFSLRK